MAIFEGMLVLDALQRIAEALEKGNEIAERRLSMEYPLSTVREPKRVSISHPTVDEWNKNRATGGRG